MLVKCCSDIKVGMVFDYTGPPGFDKKEMWIVSAVGASIAELTNGFCDNRRNNLIVARRYIDCAAFYLLCFDQVFGESSTFDFRWHQPQLNDHYAS
jgi:hypothetical protein